MINPSFKELSEVAKSRYEICTLVAKRANRIVSGSQPLADKPQSKPVTEALEEVIEGKVKKAL
ncbi:MAG: DNA-directed RNA polymerase subunit omega [Peptoniphilaceae bacterium]|nr:DNA-directed RNA polymerase subunit omega [Peptoniphilaceae bacterium]MDD7383782.1 DNA-directed RNA polymerase subunit omega [Peptoniphilaceae bacterium]MDY3738110.1 DNA-directed RNA polymerase subunit omega [Peptoniphilaceae bacterium]